MTQRLGLDDAGQAPAVDTPSGSAPHPSAPLPLLGALAAGFGLGLSLASPAFGQTGPANGGEEAELPAVTVRSTAVQDEPAKDTLQTTTTSTGRGKQAIRDIPQAVTVVTERLIDDVKLDTLKQALHYTSGITFAATENGTDQDIRLRGFPVATTGDLLIDGMRDPSQYDRDSFNVDRIEVMRGSASMLFGRGSTGGVINQVTKKPALLDQSDVVTSIGTGAYFRLTADLNRRTGEESAFRLNAMINTARNHGASIDRRGVAPSYSWGIGTPDEVTVSLFHLDVDNVPMSSLRYLGGGIADAIPAKNFYGTRSDFVKGEANYASAAWTHRFDAGGELKTQIRSGVFHRSAWGTTAGTCSMALTVRGACPDGAPPVTARTLDGQTVMTRLGLTPRKDRFAATYVQSDYSRNFQALGRKHELLAGVDASRESARRFGAAPPIGANYDKGSTRVGTPDDGTRLAIGPNFRRTSDYDATSVGAYAQDLVSLTEHWKLLGGLRVDRFSTDNSQREYLPNGTITAQPSSSLTYSALWSYRTGILYQPTRYQSYHLSLGTSFNTSADTYQYTTQEVADVPAEKSRNIELGAKLDWFNGTLSTRFALFRTEKYNERTTDVDFVGRSYTLSGQRHSQGIDFDMVGHLTPTLEVYGSYTWIQRAVIDKAGVVMDFEGFSSSAAGRPVGLSPRHSGALWLSWLAKPGLRLAFGARGASSNRPLEGGSGAAARNVRAPGYVAYDAMAEYTITPDLYVQLNVSNLTNKVYGDQLYPSFYTPGEGRSAKLTVGVRF